MTRVVVTGCGRVGTQYLTNLLALTGYRSCHETVYNYRLDPVDPDLALVEERWKTEVFEVSWQAAPFILHFTPVTHLWHQVRDPLKSLRCWSKHHILVDDYHICKLVHGVFPECGEGTSLERSIRYHVLWNKLVEEHGNAHGNYVRYKIEDLDLNLYRELINGVGLKFPEDRARFALANIRKDNRTCGHGPEDDITWEQVLETPDGFELMAMAHRYGYSPKVQFADEPALAVGR